MRPTRIRDGIMFRKLLLVVALGCSALCANAQKLEEAFSYSSGRVFYHGIIPQDVTYSRASLFWISTRADYYDRTWADVSVYDQDMQQVINIAPINGIIPIKYIENSGNNCCIPISQRIFDSGAKYEYITPAALVGDDKFVSGIAIMQEDGKTLSTLNFGNGEYLSGAYMSDNDLPIEVLLLDNKCYLLLKLWKNDPNGHAGELSIIRMYSFDMGNISTSIKKLKDIPVQMKVTPTLPKINETVKVDLADLKSPSKLSVIDSNGKVCFAQSIKAGQESMEISTSGMPAGMYIIRVTDGNKEVDNCRIIIR